MWGIGRGVVALVAGLAFAVVGVGAAEAATLKANYQLRGNLASEVAGAPDLANLGTGNGFATETVDGAARQVLRFPQGNGLWLDTAALVDPRNHSVAMLFRFDRLSGYRRILDFSGGASDNGLYDLNGKVALYVKGNVALSDGAVFGRSYAQLVLTNAPAAGGSQQTAVYVNGAAVAAATTSESFDLESGVLRFFRDNASGPGVGEESAGALACALVYDGALSAAEVAQLAADPALCPAPTPVPGQPRARATGKPQARKQGRSIVVDTGLTVSCPIGTAPCKASGWVEMAGRGRTRAAAARIRRLGAARFSLPGGTSRRVEVRLSRRGVRALRRAGRLRIGATARIVSAAGRRAVARRSGTIAAPRPRGFRSGTYTGTTSQGLPIFVGVSRTAIQSVFFSWRARCADGRTHTATAFLRGERVRRGRFAFGAVLDSGAQVLVSGRIGGVRASGTLSRTGPSAFGAKCAAKGIRWHARASRTESEAR